MEKKRKIAAMERKEEGEDTTEFSSHFQSRRRSDTDTSRLVKLTISFYGTPLTNIRSSSTAK
ncbi:MAG: hypothetical protein EBX37_16370 [Alphaproteobacteria bacterium]|nr:hypothetical protein [Alphaproteobacteria bacterium]